MSEAKSQSSLCVERRGFIGIFHAFIISLSRRLLFMIMKAIAGTPREVVHKCISSVEVTLAPSACIMLVQSPRHQKPSLTEKMLYSHMECHKVDPSRPPRYLDDRHKATAHLDGVVVLVAVQEGKEL